MNKPLRLLLVCVLGFTVTSVWAQTGKGLITAGKTARNISMGAGTASRVPQAATITTTITKQVTQAATTAQKAAQMPAPLPVTKAGFPEENTPGNKLTGWADRLITPDTKPEFATMLRSLERQMNSIRASRSRFTKEQLARINEAERYFLNLTPQQANSVYTVSSVTFRTHALVVRSPDATEYGYFFTGYNLLQEYESMYHPNEYGYIPVYLGDPKNGLAEWNMRKMIPSPAKTDRPIFVLLDVHGGINLSNNFHAGINPMLRISTNEIVRAMQELRQATGTPELNLFVDSCCAGAFLDEFEQLPLPQRQGINVFVPTGANQCTYISATAQYRTHIPGDDIAKELTEKMIEQIINGQAMVQAHIAGQSFNPLELAIQRANKLSEPYLSRGLASTFNLQKTKRHTPSSARIADESIRYFIARVAYEEATARYGKLFEGNDWFKNAMQKLKNDYAKRFDINPEDWFLEERFFDGRFDNKPLK